MHNRNAPLDLLRTLAIFLVFTDHFHSFARDFYFGRLGDFGWIGVDLFFVLSGFLISNQLFKELQDHESLSFTNFYIRRGFRIWPSFFVVLGLYVFIPAFVERSMLAPLWRYFTFSLNFGLSYRDTGAFSHAWSLCVEEQFYLLLPFLILADWKKGPKVPWVKSLLLLALIFSFGILIREILWQKCLHPFMGVMNLRTLYVTFYRELYYPTYCRLDSLSMGVFIASLYRFGGVAWERLQIKANFFLWGGVVLLATSFLLSSGNGLAEASSVFAYSLNALAFGSLVIAAISNQGLFSHFRMGWFRGTANLAFTFYLLHKSLIHLSDHWLRDAGLDPGSILYPILIFGICLSGSLLLHFLVENPFLKLRDRLLHFRSLHF